MDLFNYFIRNLLYLFSFIFGAIFLYFSKDEKYLIVIESDIKKKIHTKKPLSYNEAIKTLNQLEHQLLCQNIYGFKKNYNIYMLKHNKIINKNIPKITN